MLSTLTCKSEICNEQGPFTDCQLVDSWVQIGSYHTNLGQINELIHWGCVICIIKIGHHWLVQIMARHLLVDNLLSGPMMVYCQLDPEEHISMKFHLKFKSFNSRKCIWKCRLQKWRPSCLIVNVLNLLMPILYLFRSSLCLLMTWHR